MINKRQVGFHYESAAASYLCQNGYQILERNFYCRQGEIDIIAKEGPYLVFVEVKYRKDLDCGYPEEAVDGRKQQKIILAARYYLYCRRYSADTPCRFDVVSVLGNKVRLIQNAF